MERTLILEEGEGEAWEIKARWSGMEENILIALDSVSRKGLHVRLIGKRLHSTKVIIEGRLSSTDVYLNSISLESVIKERLAQFIERNVIKNCNKIVDLLWDSAGDSNDKTK